MRKFKLAMITVTMVCAMSFVGCGSKDKKNSAKVSPSPTASATVETEQPTASATAEAEQPTAATEAKTDSTKQVESKTNKTNTKTNQSNNKQTSKNSSSQSGSVAPGTYINTRREEIPGGNGKKSDVETYLVLNKDGTGYYVGQDTVKIEWDGVSIRAEGSPIEKYKYDAKSKTITINENGITSKYVFASSGIVATAKEAIKEMK